MIMFRSKKGWVIILLFIFFIAVIFLFIPKSKNNTQTVAENDTSSIEETEEIPVETEETPIENEETENIISVGDTIVTDGMEITIDNVQLTYEVLPDNKSDFYSYYAADSGEVYIDLDVSVKNLQKQQLNCDEVLSATADYNNGYTYSCFSVVEDSTLGFNYSSITYISPLETMDMRYLFDCPQEVEETQNPLFITIRPSDSLDEYKLIIR